MNDNPSEKKIGLLADVLSGESFECFDGGLKKQALRAFRRARLTRRLAAVSAVLCIAGTVGMGAWWLHLHEVKMLRLTASVSPIVNDSTPELTAQHDSPIVLKRISEDQLLAHFPSNSCFIAEVNGKDVLVFRDPEIGKQFIH